MTPKGSFDEAVRLAELTGPLPLSAARRTRQDMGGRHARRRAGAGSEFWQYRPLQPGESAARIDWRRSGRSDDLFVREREREDPVRLMLWLDGSESMRFRSAEDLPHKIEAGRTLLTALALAALEADESVGALGSGARGALGLYETLGAAASAVPTADLERLGSGDVVVAAGDFLDDGALGFLQPLARRGVCGVLLKIFDPAEDAFPYEGRTKFEAVEEGDPAPDLGRAEELGSRYRTAWKAHLEKLDSEAAASGWETVRHGTHQQEAATLRILAGLLSGQGSAWAA